MTELEYIDEVLNQWNKSHKEVGPTSETILLLNKAVQKYSNSEKLWIIRGNLLQLINHEIDIPLEESLRCYTRALEINPNSYEANFEMASFLNNVLDKPKEAHKFYRKALSLKTA